MKKTLAIVLSIALTLSLCAGLFVFPASAETPEKDYATTEADKLWASDAKKATSVKITLTAKADVEGATTVEVTVNNNDTVTLTEKGGFSAGTVSLKDGVLTLNKVTYDAAKYSNCVVNPNGAIKAVVNGGEFRGQIQALVVKEELKDGEGNVTETLYETDAHILLTSDDGSMFYGLGGNSLGGHGAIVVYGNVGFNVQTGGGYDGIITRPGTSAWKGDYVTGNAIILAPGVDSVIGGSGAGALIDARNGDIIFAGKAKITINQNVKAAAATKEVYAVEVTTLAKANSAIRFLEEVDVDINTYTAGAVGNRKNNGTNDSIVFNSTGNMNFIASDFKAFSWSSSMIYAAGGVVRVSSGKVFSAMTQTAYAGGCGVNVSVNAGNGPKGGVFVENDGELVVYSYGNVASGSNRVVGIWVNNGVVDVSDNGKLASYYGQAAASTTNYSPLTFKTGGLYVKDNSKVLLYHLGGNAAGSGEFVQFQSDGNMTNFGNAAGVHMLGGQLEVVAPKYAMVVSNRDYTTFDIKGGVLAIHSDAKNVFGCDFNNASVHSSTTGYAYVGPFGGTENVLTRQNGTVADWVYMGEDAAYSPYYALAPYAEKLGLKDFAQTTVLSKNATSVSVPTPGNYKVTGTNAKLGDKVIPNGAVIALKNGDVITGENVSIALTKAAVTAPAAPVAKVVDDSITSSGAKISWNAVDYALSYKVFVDGSIAGTTDKTEFELTLNPDTEYKVTVQAIGFADVAGATSAEVAVKTLPGTPAITIPKAPTNVKVSGITANAATVTWDEVEGATSYDVYLGTEKVATVTEATVAFDELTAGTAYKLTVKAVNVAGASEASAEVAFSSLAADAVPGLVVTLADGSTVDLNAENPTALNGALSFDAAKSELTMNNATGIQKIIWTDGSLTVKVVGTNTITSDSLSNNLWGYGNDANLTLVGDGTLNVTGEAYVIGSQSGDLVIDGPTVNATSTKGTGVHVAADGLDSAIIVKGTSKLNVTSKGYALDAAGIAPSIIIKDSANVKVDAQNVGIAVRANKVATEAVANKGVLQVLDKANLEVNSIGSGILMNAKVADNVFAPYETTFTTEGKVTVNSKLSGWSAAGIFFTGASADKKQTFTVKNGTLEINITQSDASEVACGIYTQKNVVVLFEDATVNATVDCSSTAKGNRGQAIYFDTSEATFKGKTVVNTMNKGSAKDMGWHPSGASLHVHASTLTIEGNAVANAKANATAKITGVALQDGKIIVKGNGKLNAESANQAALFNWDAKTNSLEVLEGGFVNLKSPLMALRTIKTFTLNETAVLSGKYTDKDLTITGPSYNPNTPGSNPGTSDVSYVAAASVAVIAVLAGVAVVILRKKSRKA